MGTRKKRLANELRIRLGQSVAELSDNQVIRKTEGTLVRSLAEMKLALDDFTTALAERGHKWIKGGA